MKFVSWNVNGIRACLKKGFLDYFNQMDADFFCIQETKCQDGQVELPLEGYHQFWNYAEKKDIPGRPYLQSICLFQSSMVSVKEIRSQKDELSLWNMIHFI